MSLEKLSLSGNKLESLPYPIGFELSRSLTDLELRDNMLTQLGSSLRGLRRLESLFGSSFSFFALFISLLSYNRITVITANEFEGLVKLRVLRLEFNKIVIVSPLAFQSLEMLQQLFGSAYD